MRPHIAWFCSRFCITGSHWNHSDHLWKWKKSWRCMDTFSSAEGFNIQLCSFPKLASLDCQGVSFTLRRSGMACKKIPHLVWWFFQLQTYPLVRGCHVWWHKRVGSLFIPVESHETKNPTKHHSALYLNPTKNPLKTSSNSPSPSHPRLPSGSPAWALHVAAAARQTSTRRLPNAAPGTPSPAVTAGVADFGSPVTPVMLKRPETCSEGVAGFWPLWWSEF